MLFHSSGTDASLKWISGGFQAHFLVQFPHWGVYWFERGYMEFTIMASKIRGSGNTPEFMRMATDYIYR